ncbi:MAG: TRAFs-binding domain-containing protein [Litorimonas sp.]
MSYRDAVARLKQYPSDQNQQYLAVLALARAGSLDVALAEYKRFNLNTVRHHEDIMALEGRLYKDLYLAAPKSGRRKLALTSSEKYEAAYNDTLGYFSGINSATMAYIGGVPMPIIAMRAKRLLKQIAETEPDIHSDRYFVDATRAEAHCLLGDYNASRAFLRKAWDHDPLNYTTHASTLKQFAMIADYRGECFDWLEGFDPPKTAHYAGHLFAIGATRTDGVTALSVKQCDALRRRLSESIQICDIGFAYGSLAAGSDIMIAEAILEEGGQLHVTLPVEPSRFAAVSVLPFGQDWAARYERCITQSTSVQICAQNHDWPKADLDIYASIISMGKALRQATHLRVTAEQMLIWDRIPQGNTARLAEIWSAVPRGTSVLEFLGRRRLDSPSLSESVSEDIADGIVCLSESPAETATQISGIAKALAKACELRSSGDREAKFGLCLKQERRFSSKAFSARSLAEEAPPGTILLSNALASHVAVCLSDQYDTVFAGVLETGEAIFALKQIGR